MRDIYEFRVIGVPRPGGSKKAFLHPKTRRVVVTDDCRKNKDWRQDVKTAALDAHIPCVDEPVILEIVFYFQRPKSHFGSGKNAGRIKSAAPLFHSQKPDVTKLIRSTEDALTGIAWRDDSQIIVQTATKRWCNPGELPGASIKIRPINHIEEGSKS